MRFLTSMRGVHDLVTQQRGAVSASYLLTNQEEENVGIWRELFFFLKTNDWVTERLRFGWSLWACLFAHHRVEINVPNFVSPPGLGLRQLCSSTRQELALPACRTRCCHFMSPPAQAVGELLFSFSWGKLIVFFSLSLSGT